MPDFPSFAELFQTARAEILFRNPRLTVEAVDREGSDSNAMLAGACSAGDEVVAQLASAAASLFLGSASGDALDRLVFDRYGIVRKPASAAIGTVTFQTATTNLSPFTIQVGTLVGTPDGRQYSTTAAVLFPAGTAGPVFVPMRSVLAGLDQQAAPGTITSLLSPIAGQPTNLTVTNPLATAGADNAEGDSALRARAQGFFTSARRGTLGALEQAALGVSGIRRATAIEAIDSLGRPARLVQLVVADAFVDALATLDSVPATFPAQSQMLAQGVASALEDVRAAGVFVEVVVAQVVLVPVAIQLRFYAGADPNQVSLMARAAIAAFINNLAPGQSLSLVTMLATLRNIPGLAFFGDEIIGPVGDIVVHPLQVLRSTLALVTTQAVALTQAQTQQTITSGRVIPPVAGTTVDQTTVTAISQVNSTAVATALTAVAAIPVVSSLATPVLTQSLIQQLLRPFVNPTTIVNYQKV